MNQRVVEQIEYILGRAKRGEVASVAIAVVEPELSTGSAFTLGDGTLSELLGAIDLMKHRIMSEAEAGELN